MRSLKLASNRLCAQRVHQSTSHLTHACARPGRRSMQIPAVAVASRHCTRCFAALTSFVITCAALQRSALHDHELWRGGLHWSRSVPMLKHVRLDGECSVLGSHHTDQIGQNAWQAFFNIYVHFQRLHIKPHNLLPGAQQASDSVLRGKRYAHKRRIGCWNSQSTHHWLHRWPNQVKAVSISCFARHSL